MDEEVKPSLAESLKALFHATHPVIVLYTSAVLEGILEKAILSKMRSDLSNVMKEDLFEGYGPLASFSAKIDIAFAFDVIDANVRSDLKIIKGLRNLCAHPEQFHNFNDEAMVKICKKFKEYKTGGDNYQLFKQKLSECVGAITDDNSATLFIEALNSLPSWPHESSHEKSP